MLIKCLTNITAELFLLYLHWIKMRKCTTSRFPKKNQKMNILSWNMCMKKHQCYGYWCEDDLLCFSWCFERMVCLSELSIIFHSRMSKWSSRTIVLDAFKWGSRKPGYSAMHSFIELESFLLMLFLFALR